MKCNIMQVLCDFSCKTRNIIDLILQSLVFSVCKAIFNTRDSMFVYGITHSGVSYISNNKSGFLLRSIHISVFLTKKLRVFLLMLPHVLYGLRGLPSRLWP
jgi:hypothetical protein